MATNNSANTYIVPTTANEVTMPSQPAFLAYLGAGDTDANVTGNAGAYVLGSGNALTEVYDQNADFNVNGTFTSPVTGRYYLCYQQTYSESGGATTQVTQIVTSNRTYSVNAGGNVSVANFTGTNISAVTDMDAADTATLNGNLNGIGGNTADSFGNVTLFTFFCGNLEV